MREIPLSNTRRCKNRGKYVAIVDDCDFDSISAVAWSALVIKSRAEFPLVYAQAKSGGGTLLMHREIWRSMTGSYPPIGLEIDHISQDGCRGLNNTRLNLRTATRLQQFGNTRKKLGTVSGLRGVYWHRKASKWAAQIHVNDRPKYLGLFPDEADAGRAYDAAAIVHFGEFATLNFPSAGSAALGADYV